MAIYKPELASRTRWACATVLLALAVFGAYRSYAMVPSSLREPIGGLRGVGTLLGSEFPISWAVVMATVFLVGAAVGTFFLLNWPRLVEFFGETEQEMKNVAWASRQEVTGSSMVVIITVVILGVWITLVDTVIILVQNWVR